MSRTVGLEGLYERGVVADQDHRALVGLQGRADGLDRLDVQVVGGLVQEQDVVAAQDQPGQGELGLLAAGQGPGRLVGLVAAEQEVAEHAPEQVVGGLGDLPQRLHGGGGGVEPLVLLGVVAEFSPVAAADLALVGLVDAGQDAQQRGLAGPVEPQHQQPLAPLEVEGDVLEHRRPAVGAGQVDGVQREAPRGGGSGTGPPPSVPTCARA